jgi:hypothetical protein
MYGSIYVPREKEERQAGIVSIDLLFAVVGAPQNENFGVIFDQRLTN